MKNDLTIEQEDFVKTCIKVGGNIITGSRDDKIRIYDISVSISFVLYIHNII